MTDLNKLFKKPEYKILVDYGTEGLAFMDPEFETVNEAVQAAIAYQTSHRFYIVKICYWEAVEQ